MKSKGDDQIKKFLAVALPTAILLFFIPLLVFELDVIGIFASYFFAIMTLVDIGTSYNHFDIKYFWPRTVGKITGSFAHKKTSTTTNMRSGKRSSSEDWVPHISYSYSVNGKELSSTHISDTRRYFTSKASCERYLARFKDPLTVYFAKDDASRSIFCPLLRWPAL